VDPIVEHFRQILLWPLELMPLRREEQIQKHWQVLERAPATPWREVEDEFTPDAELFQERHYSEFVTFLPYVQRFLYGESRDREGAQGESPIRVFRRTDVTRARLALPGQDGPIVLDVVHVDLYFFYDIDVVILVVELAGAGLGLPRVQETLYRLGRAYPTHWDSEGQGGHCPTRLEWLAADGGVLAVSDYEKREKFLAHVCRYRTPAIASHWEFLLTPMRQHQSDAPGVLRYRPIEHHRMPLLGYLAMGAGPRLRRADFVRLGLVTAPGAADVLPFSERHVADFEARYCYDRYWDDQAGGTRYLCSGEALMMVGNAADPYVVDADAGLLAHFRHQHFLLFLIAHFHRAALVMLSDRLVDALSRLDIKDAESVKQFKRSIRHLKEIFLRFTPLLVSRDLRPGAGASAVPYGPRRARHRPPLRGGARRDPGHEQLPGQRLAPAAGQHRHPPHGRDDGGTHRHRQHRLPRHEPDRGGRRAPAGEAFVLRPGAGAHHRDHGVLHPAIQAAGRLPGGPRRRASARPEQAGRPRRHLAGTASATSPGGRPLVVSPS
jgi:hypothetical protein